MSTLDEMHKNQMEALEHNEQVNKLLSKVLYDESLTDEDKIEMIDELEISNDEKNRLMVQLGLHVDQQDIDVDEDEDSDEEESDEDSEEDDSLYQYDYYEEDYEDDCGCDEDEE